MDTGIPLETGMYALRRSEVGVVALPFVIRETESQKNVVTVKGVRGE